MDIRHIRSECEEYPRILHEILSVPHNLVMDLNNVVSCSHLLLLFNLEVVVELLKEVTQMEQGPHPSRPLPHGRHAISCCMIGKHVGHLYPRQSFFAASTRRAAAKATPIGRPRRAREGEQGEPGRGYRRKPRVSSGNPLVLTLAALHCHDNIIFFRMLLVW